MTPPVTGMPDYKGMFQQACDQIAEAIKTVVNKINAFFKHVYDNRFFLGPALLAMKGALNTIKDLTKRLVDLVQYLFDHQLPVISLIVQSFNWVTGVHNPMSNLSGQVQTPVRDSFEAWTGPARIAYNNKAAMQKAAIDDYVKKSEFVSTWLFTIVKTNVDYVAGLGGIVAKLAAGLITATAEGAVVVMIPFAAKDVADMLKTIVEAGINTLIQYAKNFVGALGNVRDIASQIGDASVFTNGRWPEAVRN